MNVSSPSPTCDLVVPVHNSLAHLVVALESVLAYTQGVNYRLILVDDASDQRTAGYLTEIAAQRPGTLLHRLPENQGFVRAANLGLRCAEAPFVLLLNTDVVVTPGWLEGLLEVAEQDATIGAVNPLTTRASHLDLAMVPGANFFGMHDWLSRQAQPQAADIVTGVGFCLLLRRQALDAVGLFDEVFGRGYGEDSDLCMRLTTARWRTVVATHVYVYHQGGGSFTDSDARKRHNRVIFDQRWQAEYRRQFRAFRRAAPLAPLRARLAPNTGWDPRPLMWETGRALFAAMRIRDWRRVAHVAARGLWHLPRARVSRPDATLLAEVSRPGRLRLTYVIPRLVIAGGVLSVIQLVNELVLLGVEARIATLFVDPAVRTWMPLYSQPMVFRNAAELVRDLPECDLVVATLWQSAPWVAALQARGRARASAYFLQDYEPWFFPEHDSSGRARVRATYAVISNRIVKSDWLRERLSDEGYDSHKIRLGINLAVFYPRDVGAERPRVLAMARPGVPQRGFAATIEALAQVKAARADVEIVLFGDRRLANANIPFAFRNEGLVTDQNRLATLYSEATVFLDGSDFQGFGRGGLEAMACATACVLTNVGGVNEYARHGHNAWMVPPRQPARLAEAILALLHDPEQRARQVATGLETAATFCHRREARETLAYFQSIMAEPLPA